MPLTKRSKEARMVERLLDLIMRLKKIFMRMESDGNETAQLQKDYSDLTQVNKALNDHVVGLQERVDLMDKDHQEALAMLDELEEVIKKWESYQIDYKVFVLSFNPLR